MGEIEHVRYLAQAVDLATQNVANGGGPFGAVIVTADGRTFNGVNRVTATNDPTAHAEVTAIRAACSALDTFTLAGCVLYSSCEPCPMCLASALWARVDAVYFAADRHDAAAAGFDDAVFYEFFDTPVEQRPMPVAKLPLDGEGPAAAAATPLAPFAAWNDLETRTEY
ncbi:nucleoside deaminase [Arthrobacter sp. 35W]|uniref:nucleoside deaminase n=1 Tax=Arthrobacter sp. 35W TaxID=1132441 RepID=UPI0003FD559E|nr:nucleoside deaminase [Arthrobacter sp. 35W]